MLKRVELAARDGFVGNRASLGRQNWFYMGRTRVSLG